MFKLFAQAMLGILSTATMTNPNPTTQPADAMAQSSNLFAMDLYSQMSHANGNICVSPFSISSALEMTSAGAAGKTQQQMLSVLHWNLPASELPAAASALNSSILTAALSEETHQRDIGNAQVSIANALFGQQGYPYKQPFLDVLSKQYAAPLQELDFATRPAQACDEINHWAAQQTHDRIQNAVPASAITPATRLVLVDAIYFKAAWQEKFEKSATQDQPFFVSPDVQVSVPLMQEQKHFNYAENDSLQAVELPYQGAFSMVILLPKQRDGLAELEKSFSSDSLNQLLGQLSSTSVRLFFPKFKTTGEFILNDILSQLGMSDAFDPSRADFSGMSSSDKFCISHVIHKTFISVDESGTEAAAVTSVAMTMTAVMPGHRVEPVSFRADHPFMFILRHRRTGAILFMGRVITPK